MPSIRWPRPATDPDVGAPASAAGERLRTRVAAIRLPRPELLGLLVLAAVLYLWALDQNGWANEYYSAAVRSMSSSWHNFLYDSFDPSGVMTVDKPPLGLWVQALSVRVFGFHSLSMLVPQALMGIASVALVYDLTRRRFGRAGGFVAGAVLALTPIAVAVSRHNNPDALLVLCVVGALWAMVRALEDGRTRWVVVSGVCVGLGFEAKMAAALLVVPALAAAWLWMSPRGAGASVRSLLAAGPALAVSTRLRRTDKTTGWLIATGGSALTAGVPFSTAKGIFHPYYVSELAPFTAALVGAGFARFARRDVLARVAGPLAVAAGV